MHFFAAGVVLFLLLIGIAHLFIRADPKALARSLKIGAAVAAGLTGLVLTFAGRVGLGLAAFALAYSILAGRRFGAPFGMFGLGSAPSGGQRSQVRSAALEMELDHDTGHMTGRVLAGRFEGRDLDDLDESDLQDLAREIEGDDESLALLEAYFDRRFPGWREDVDPDERAGEGSAPQAGTMTDDEAYQILGVSPGATESDIVAAHRRLMQKVHPDRGGSTFLAAKINEAKDRLLGKHGSTRTQH